MARKKKPEEHENHERWLVSYADFITLLFATFTALYGISTADLAKFDKLKGSMHKAFNNSSDSSMIALPSVNLEGGGGVGSQMTINITTADPYASMSSGTSDSSSHGQEDDPYGEFDSMGSDVEGDGEGWGESPSPTPSPTPAPQSTPPPDAEQNPGSPGSLGVSEGMSEHEGIYMELQDLLNESGLQGQVEVRREKRGTVISLGEAAFFKTGGVGVLAECQAKLDKIVNALRNKSFQIRIEGHTDDQPVTSGRWNSNLELSALRAARVVEFMIDEYGFPPGQISSAGYGEWRPVADNASEGGRQQNRRVDIVILNQWARKQEPKH